MGVKSGCKPRDDVRQGELDDAIFAASFGKLIRNEGPEIYRKPERFFQNTHPTSALSRLCRDVFGRLASPTESGAVLRLSTGFGGGKTHALMTLWHLARNIGNPAMGSDVLAPAGRPKRVRVVGIDAEGAGYPIFARHDDQEARSLAAELAFQLGGASALNALGPANSAAASPDDRSVEAMLPSEPILILLDELVLYMAKLTRQEVGNLVGFLRTLITAIVSRHQAVLVITDPADQPADAQNAARLGQLAREFEQQTGRQATVIEPIGNETAQVIIRRLFESVDPAAAAKVSADYHALYKRVAEEHPELVPEEARSIQYAERIRVCYPLHPRLLKTAEERLRVLPDYNLSRGTLRLFARVIRSVWDDPTRDPELISAGEIDWSSDLIQTDLLERLDREKFRAAVAADVIGHAGELDESGWGSHRRVASALLLESLPLEATSGFSPSDLTLAVLRPDEAGTEPAESLDRLSGTCWHLYPMSGSASAWQFRYEPNILKQIEERMGQVLREDALDRLKTDVQKSFQGAFGKLLPWPPNARAVPEEVAPQFQTVR
jgi:predicted AAA+ superfamily ATPase